MRNSVHLRLVRTFSLLGFGLFSSLAIADEIPIIKGSTLQYVGYHNPPVFTDPGVDFFITFLEVEPDFLSQAQNYPDANQHLVRTVTQKALEMSRVYSGSYYEGGPDKPPSITAAEFSRLVLRELSETGRSKVEIRDHSATANGHAIINKSGDLVLVERGIHVLAVDGILGEYPVLVTKFQGRFDGTFEGRPFTHDVIADLEILDGDHPLILQGRTTWSEDIRNPNATSGSWAYSMVGVFSSKGLRQRLETVVPEGEAVSLSGIRFAFGSDQMDPHSVPYVETIAEVLAANPGWDIKLTGRTDFIGSDNNNISLSERRAETVKRELERLGISSERLSTNGAGETTATQNGTHEQRAWDRRVELSRIN